MEKMYTAKEGSAMKTVLRFPNDKISDIVKKSFKIFSHRKNEKWDLLENKKHIPVSEI